MTEVNGGADDAMTAIRSGLESQMIVHDEKVVFQGDDESQFTVFQTDVSVDGESGDGEGDGAGDGAPRTHSVLFAQVRGGQPSAVCIPVRSDGRLLLVRHWRIATDSFEWEFPRSMGVPGEVSGATAERELLAEAGVGTDGRRLLQMIHADTCKLRDSVAVVEAKVSDEEIQSGAEAADNDTQAVRADNDPFRADVDDTDSRLAWLTPEEIDTMIVEGNIMDGITLAAYLIWKIRR
ncbi:NUDIX hydrolase [Bifidobacterium tissieri]|uniref:NUDIX domain-containing protein n=1 Tax=Bifidobacterium tissieri TaxID=1630162 RepID=A0A5M9ZJS8_9BIFI|nr:NUDIX domain-containing protein [Bifidobacterium tissieri]KAA8827583.1 NUDIX domain-containing protein [Bifidobacterium tissieri]KAA8830975.1 NUDIX domain-containing protein [Bifidobacterium tissieri]